MTYLQRKTVSIYIVYLQRNCHLYNNDHIDFINQRESLRLPQKRWGESLPAIEASTSSGRCYWVWGALDDFPVASYIGTDDTDPKLHLSMQLNICFHEFCSLKFQNIRRDEDFEVDFGLSTWSTGGEQLLAAQVLSAFSTILGLDFRLMFHCTLLLGPTSVFHVFCLVGENYAAFGYPARMRMNGGGGNRSWLATRSFHPFLVW